MAGRDAASGSESGSRQWVSSLSEGERVDEVYMVWRKNKLLSRNGRAYLALQVGDRTGRVEARAWERADELDQRFSVHDLVRVRGQVVRYQDHLQLKVDDILSVEADGAARPDASSDGESNLPRDLELFLPRSARPVAEMWGELLEMVAGLPDPNLRRLLRDLLGDPDVSARFQAAPAAKTIHHAWRGGLVEHTLSVCGLVQAMWRHYEKQFPGLLDRSLLVAGAILHDLGKVWEMDPLTFEYTDEGRLLGHMSLMLMELDRRIRAIPEFPRSLALHLEHLILSHHGELQYGSPKRPKTPEAWVLHYADILDGRMMWMNLLLADLEPGEWSPYQRLYDRYFWKPPRTGPSEDLPGDLEEDGLDAGAMGFFSRQARPQEQLEARTSFREEDAAAGQSETKRGRKKAGAGKEDAKKSKEDGKKSKEDGKKKTGESAVVPLLPGLAVPDKPAGPDD